MFITGKKHAGVKYAAKCDCVSKVLETPSCSRKIYVIRLQTDTKCELKFVTSFDLTVN